MKYYECGYLDQISTEPTEVFRVRVCCRLLIGAADKPS